jgi:hypothetical protein
VGVWIDGSARTVVAHWWWLMQRRGLSEGQTDGSRCYHSVTIIIIIIIIIKASITIIIIIIIKASITITTATSWRCVNVYDMTEGLSV